MKKIIPLIIILLTLTGCVKMEVNMEIRKDKSMTLGIIQAINKSLMDKGYSSSDILEDDEKKNLQENGFKIESYSENQMEGYKITKEVKNIDQVSTEKEITTDLGLDKLSNSEYMFIVKKGIFKNTYKAILKNSDTDELNNSLNDGLTDNSSPDDVIEDDGEIITEEDEYFDYDIDMTEEDNSSSDLDDFDYSTLMSSIELNLKVNLPYKALSNNATSVENDGKTLTWDLMSFNEEEIKFEFELYNTTNIIIAAVSGILLIVIIIILIIKKGKKNKKVSTNTNEVQPTNITQQQNITSTPNNVHETNNVEQQNVTSTPNEVPQQSYTTNEIQSQPMDTTNSSTAQTEETNNIEQPTNLTSNNTQPQEIDTTNNFIDKTQIINNLEQISNSTNNNVTTQEPIMENNNNLFEQSSSTSFQNVIESSIQTTQEQSQDNLTNQLNQTLQQPQENNNTQFQTNEIFPKMEQEQNKNIDTPITITPLTQPMNLEQIGATQPLQQENQQPQELNNPEKSTSQYDSILPTNTDN